MLTVLLLPARPEDAGSALLERVRDRLSRNGSTRQIFLISQPATPEELRSCLLTYRPDIIHVYSLGSPAGMLLQDEPGLAVSVLAEHAVRCIVLDGCFEPQQAQALSRFTDCVIGMSAESEQSQRHLFTYRFYKELADSQRLGTAVHNATHEMGPLQRAPQVLLRPGVRPSPEPAPPSSLDRVLENIYRSPQPGLPHINPVKPVAASSPSTHSRSIPSAAAVSRPAASVASRAPAAAGPRSAEIDESDWFSDALDGSSGRYLNASFFRGNLPIPPGETVAIRTSPIRLGVNIGAFVGPGERGPAVPTQLLAPLFEHQSVLVLDVVLRSQEVAVTPSVQKLQLPASGESPRVFFELAFSRNGRHALSVDLLFRGHLLQSRQIECEVATNGDPAPTTSAPPQYSRITFTRTAELGPQALAQLQSSPRKLTIVAERHPQTNSIGLRFYGNTNVELVYRDTRLTDTSLSKVLKILRGQLVTTMHAYAGGIGGSAAELGHHLGQLADLGRRFHRALLPDLGPGAGLGLTQGSVIQVAPLSAQLSVPWELLYERPIETYRKDAIRLCPYYIQHGSDPCPHQDDAQVVCPYGFWGYRYIIEQLPCRVVPGEPCLDSLPMVIQNRRPLEVCAVVNTRLRLVARHLAALARLEGLRIVQIQTAAQLKQELKQPSQPADILYFYTHGGCDDFGSPYLEIGQDTRVLPNDFDAWCTQLFSRPLIVLNACESASYSPEHFDDLIHLLCSRGAAGLIAAQCEIREVFAHDFILSFLGSFLRQVPAGPALLQARHALLRASDPRGLAYSLFAAAEVRLGVPLS